MAMLPDQGEAGDTGEGLSKHDVTRMTRTRGGAGTIFQSGLAWKLKIGLTLPFACHQRSDADASLNIHSVSILVEFIVL